MKRILVIFTYVALSFSFTAASAEYYLENPPIDTSQSDEKTLSMAEMYGDTVTAQSPALSQQEAVAILTTALTIATQIKGSDLINGVPNTLLGVITTAVTSLIYGLIHRRREKNKLRKAGLLKD